MRNYKRTLNLEQIHCHHKTPVSLGGGNAGGGNGGGAATATAVDTSKQDILAELAEVGHGPEEMPLIMSADTVNGVTIGTNGFNYAPTTPLLVPHIQSYAYMDDLAKVNPAINPVAILQYALDEFCHVEESSPAVSAGFSNVGTSRYTEYVTYIAGHGIMNGNADGTFNPKGSLTRAEMCQIIYNFAGKPETSGIPAYEDVNTSSWYAAPVAWCCENGISAGQSDTEFAPTAAITREEAAGFLYHYAASQGKETPAGDLSAFADAGSVSASMADAMSWAVGAGIINGSTETALSPAGTATRAEIAAMMRFCEAA